MVGFREERVARNEVAAREINEAIEDVVEESDGFLTVAKRGGTPEDIAVRTDPRR
jgi:hypothetical protein